MNEEVKKPARALTGKVVSNKMDKTIAVEIERLIKHERYGKYTRRTPSCWRTTRTRKPARVTPSRSRRAARCRAASRTNWSRSSRKRAPNDPVTNNAQRRGQQRRAHHDVHQGARRLEAPLCPGRR